MSADMIRKFFYPRGGNILWTKAVQMIETANKFRKKSLQYAFKNFCAFQTV